MKQVDHQGGMKEKYSVLLSYLMAAPEARITKLTRDNIQLVVKADYIANHFSILERFTDVVIYWSANSALGEFNEKWQFPQHLDQHEMAEKIGRDMEFKINNFGDYNELARRISKAEDEIGDEFESVQ
jgi:hypothetical protein